MEEEEDERLHLMDVWDCEPVTLSQVGKLP